MAQQKKKRNPSCIKSQKLIADDFDKKPDDTIDDFEQLNIDSHSTTQPDTDAFKTALDKANACYHTSLKKLSDAHKDDNSDIS